MHVFRISARLQENSITRLDHGECVLEGAPGLGFTSRLGIITVGGDMEIFGESRIEASLSQKHYGENQKKQPQGFRHTHLSCFGHFRSPQAGVLLPLQVKW